MKLFVRQEHLILAINIISLIWDCPINCTLKRPDLLYELDDIYLYKIMNLDTNRHKIDYILKLQIVYIIKIKNQLYYLE